MPMLAARVGLVREERGDTLAARAGQPVLRAWPVSVSKTPDMDLLPRRVLARALVKLVPDGVSAELSDRHT